ncbi:glycosyltransferase [Domibacillus mangrovi]|uniref:Glycosyl transferase n=1 Tax=Domibacillus mangrovi TaxID=1714354 RepID=A0A1Q5P310_9BACI|nr:glycosyltransferase [Domibacillus mangrovi]OKL36563.1 glycosyl transferase [Domibacillus mangrovi]
MKKKIVFMVINMNVGGTEKALLNMIAEIPKDHYEITILMLEEYGGFLSSIPEDVHIEYVKGYKDIKDRLNKPLQKTAAELLKKGRIIKVIHTLSLHAVTKATSDRSAWFKHLLKDMPDLKNEYDVAIAYAGPMDFISYFVAKKIKAKKKIQWIHFDITKIGFNKNFANKTYSTFDKIFVVSKDGKNKVMSMLPTLKEKTEAFPNIMPKELVLKMADQGEGFKDEFKGIRILTVGRLSKEKGQDLVIPVLASLKENGYDVRWYCIGEGNARKEYEERIKEYGVEKEFILLGADPNPYPYMKQCDIYVQPSRHEGYCITLAEARCFDNPIVCTDFTGASEQILTGQNGLIVQFDESQMYQVIQKLLDDEKMRNKIKANLRKETVDIRNELEKLYKVADGI